MDDEIDLDQGTDLEDFIVETPEDYDKAYAEAEDYASELEDAEEDDAMDLDEDYDSPEIADLE